LHVCSLAVHYNFDSDYTFRVASAGARNRKPL
jgi:hypothetical protein